MAHHQTEQGFLNAKPDGLSEIYRAPSMRPAPPYGAAAWLLPGGWLDTPAPEETIVSVVKRAEVIDGDRVVIETWHAWHDSDERRYDHLVLSCPFVSGG